MADSAANSKFRTYGALAAFVLLLVAAAITAKSLGLFELTDRKHLAEAIQRVQDVRGIALWFVLAYALIAGLGLPATPLTLAGGGIFGTVLGSGLNWTGAVLGATIGHILARQLGSDGLKRLLGKNAAKLESFSKRLTFATILRLRLIPVTPFNLLNFASGLARVPLRAYVPATAIGILPGTIIYTFFSDSLIGGVAGAQTHALLRVSIAAALLILISFLPKLFERGRRSGAAANVMIAALVLSSGLLTTAPTAAQSSPASVRVATPTLPGPAFDHSTFDQLLRAHVVNGLVDYDTFEQSADFQRYLGALTTAKPASLARAEQLAFWINAYNAYTIALMNQHHERKSIRNINKTFGLVSIKG
ncbi:MAG: VTT domain-containing protein, partial [Gemmatimonadaceae bacterium]